MHAAIRQLILGITYAVSLTISSLSYAQGMTKTDQRSHKIPTTTITIMTFNIENGGTQVSFDKVVESVKKAKADVVGIQEAWGNTERLAKALGWNYYNKNQAIISRLPILEPKSSHAIYTLIEVQPGKVVAMANMHLPDEPYGPDLIKKGASARELEIIEKNVRMPTALPYINQLTALASQGIPVFLTGDFNSPSHLNWTQAHVIAKDHPISVNWSVTKLIQDKGLSDSYRVIHPNSVQTPGATWPAGRPFLKDSIDGFNPSAQDLPDRLDFIFTAGKSRPIKSQIIGEANNPKVDITVSPYPSDHRAVATTFIVTPSPTPVIIAALNKTPLLGMPIELNFHAPLGGKNIVTVTDPIGVRISKIAIGCTDGIVTIKSQHLKPTDYKASLSHNGQVIARNGFTVVDPHAQPTIELVSSVIKPRKPISISWHHAPGNRYDYIRISPKGSTKLAWGEAVRLYTKGEINGHIQYGAPNVKGNWVQWHKGEEGKWPLPPGVYNAELMLDDSLTPLANTTFRIADK